MSIIVFSCLNKEAPLLINLSATSSCNLPSKIKCCLRTSGLGLSLLSNTSLSDNLWLGGKGTPKNQNKSNLTWQQCLLYLSYHFLYKISTQYFHYFSNYKLWTIGPVKNFQLKSIGPVFHTARVIIFRGILNVDSCYAIGGFWK